MPDWRALLRLKSKRSPTSQLQKTTPSPARSTDTPNSETVPVASSSTIQADQQQPSPKRPTSETPKARDRDSTTVANGLRLALRLLKEAVTGIGVPGLEAAVSGVMKVIDIIENVYDNDEDLGSLGSRISKVAAAVSGSPNLHPRDQVPEGLQMRMKAFLRELQVLLDEVGDILSDRRLVSRTANSEAYRNAILKINIRIDQLIVQFSAEGIISLELNVASARQDVLAIGNKVDNVKEVQLAQEYEALIEKIPRVHARYNDTSTKPSRPCHDGTRTELLQGINQWIKGEADDTPYLWLCGEVGVGKTTVAHTIAKEQEGLKQLGASFFFSRHDSGRQAPHLLFPSLAYQLARFDRGIWRALAEVLRPDPDVVNRGLTEQFTKLILGPLFRSGMAPSRTIVIIIDGLDECSDPAAVLDALALGVKFASVRLRVLVCSRPYAAIQSKFKYTQLYHLASQTHFHDINSNSLSNDVAIFLTWSLREMASRPANSDLPSPWPAERQLAELINRASGLFIIASTYAKYIDDPVEGNPAAQLRRILCRKRVIGAAPLAELDAQYDQVLDDLRRSLRSSKELVIARDVVETIILAKSEMSLETLSCLLVMEPSDVRSVLRRLTAVILVPEAQDGVITPFHASFGEYIQDDSRCTVQELSVDTTSAHGRIAARCITTLSSAAENGITGVEYRAYNIPLVLKYASKNLAAHISSSDDDDAGRDREIAMQPGFWTWLNLMFTIEDAPGYINKSVKKAGFGGLLKAEGRGADASAATDKSIGRLMIAKHALAINHNSETSLQRPAFETESFDTRRSKGIQVMRFAYPEDKPISERLRDTVGLLADARRWNIHNNPNMFVKGVAFDLNSLRELRLLVSSANTFRGICSLSKYLEKMSHLDTLSRIRLALEIASTLRMVHETSPLRHHAWINPDFVLVSVEGKHVSAPGAWVVDESSELGDSDDRGSFDCRMIRLSRWGDASWTFPEVVHYRSPQALQLIDVWHFGSVLFQIMTTHHPLKYYRQLAKGNAALGYDEGDDDVPDSYWSSPVEDDVRRARFETTVSLLIDTINGCEEVKPVLKACWAFGPQDRPSMRIIVEQLENIIRAGEVP